MEHYGQQCRCYFGNFALNVLYQWKKQIDRALLRSGGLVAWEEVVNGIASGHMQIWPGEKSCIVTQLSVYPKLKALRVFLAAGDVEEILAMTPEVAKWAKQQGCGIAEFEGRLGWEKPLQNAGWRRRSVVMQLDLGDADGREKHVED